MRPGTNPGPISRWVFGISPSARAQMTVDAVRYRLTPQMREYDRLLDRAETRWLPFIMFFHPADFRSEVVSTDRLGFRPSIAGGAPYSLGGREPSGKVNLLVGGSTAMGLGATSDAATIPSILNGLDSSGAIWLNLGGRGFTSTQELLLFLLHGTHLAGRVEHIVLLSGLNNLVLAGLRAPANAQEYGLFFFSDDYEKYMAISNRAAWSWQKTLSDRLLKFGNSLVAGESETTDGADLPTLEQRVATAVALIRRDLSLWSMVADSWRAKLTYCLQPFASWAKDGYSEEEAELFQALDSHPANSGTVLQAIQPREVGDAYARAVKDCCAAMHVPFADLSQRLRQCEASSGWTFVDRAHLNDDGYRLLAELIALEARSGRSSVLSNAPQLHARQLGGQPHGRQPHGRSAASVISHIFDD